MESNAGLKEQIWEKNNSKPTQQHLYHMTVFATSE